MKIKCFSCKKEINTDTEDYLTYTWGEGEMSDTEYCCSEKCKPYFKCDEPSIFIKGELENNILMLEYPENDFRRYTRNGKYSFYWSSVSNNNHKTWPSSEPYCYPDEHICGDCGYETPHYEELNFDGTCISCHDLKIKKEI